MLAHIKTHTHTHAYTHCSHVARPPKTEELGTAIMPGGAETWAAAAHPALAPYQELTPSAATALHHHATLLQHPTLTQLPVRVSYPPLFLLPLSAVLHTVTCVLFFFLCVCVVCVGVFLCGCAVALTYLSTCTTG